MKHSNFLKQWDAAAAIRATVETFQKTNGKTPYKAAAALHGLSLRAVLGRMRWLKARPSPPRMPHLGDYQHGYVCKVASRFSFDTIEALKVKLIHNYRATGPRYGTMLSGPVLRILLKVSGLEHFRYNGRWYVHWKHAPPKIHNS